MCTCCARSSTAPLCWSRALAVWYKRAVPAWTGERAIGIMIGGVPVGEDDFVFEVMRRKADEIVSYVDHTISSLRGRWRSPDRPHSA